MKSFDDFANNVLDGYFDSILPEIVEDVKEKKNTLYSDLSENDKLISMSTHISISLSLNLLEQYHEWLTKD